MGKAGYKGKPGGGGGGGVVWRLSPKLFGENISSEHPMLATLGAVEGMPGAWVPSPDVSGGGSRWLPPIP